MAEKEVLEQKIKAKLSDLDAKIQDLRTRVMEKSEDMQAKTQEELESAESERNDIAHMLTELRETADDAWEGAKDRFQSFVDGLDDMDDDEENASLMTDGPDAVGDELDEELA